MSGGRKYQDSGSAFKVFDEMSETEVSPDVVMENTGIGGFCRQNKGYGEAVV